MKNEKGITITTLVVTIIVMIILASIALNFSVGKNGVIEKSEKAKFFAEISEIQELIKVNKALNEEQNYDFATLKTILGKDTEYNDMLYVENGKLVYDVALVTEKQAEWLQEKGIFEKKNIIPIYDVEQFLKIGSEEIIEINGIQYKFQPNATYYLQNDIDYGGSAETLNEPITTTFKGVLDGQEYAINNVYMSGTGNKAIFSTNSGTIENLNIENLYIKSTTQSYLGSICCKNYGKIQNVYLKDVSIIGIEPQRCGGITGSNYGEVKNISVYNFEGSVVIVGTNFANSKVSNCHNKEYNALKNVVLVNINVDGAVIENCSNLANSGEVSYAAGICYKNSGIVINCYNLGNIKNTSYYQNAGVVYTNNATGKIINCYNKGDIHNRISDASAGVCFANYGLIIGCYNEGLVTATNRRCGGICTNNYSTGIIISSYNLGDANNCFFVRTNSGKIYGCYDKTSRNVMKYDGSGTIENSYYYNTTAGEMYDVTTATEITLEELETEKEALKRLLQTANNALAADEDYETKKVTWDIDENINGGYPCFDWQKD